MATYRELVGRFPASRAAERARLKVAALADQFALKEFQNGVFYLRLGGFDSAIIYFRSVVANFPQSKIVPDALLKLVESYRRIGYQEEVRETCDHLRQFYPGAAGLTEVCPPTPTPAPAPAAQP